MPLPNENEPVFEQTSGGGCLMLFALGGLLVYIAAFSGNADDMPLYIAIPFGGVFLAVGLGIMFGRSGIRIDKQAGTAASWWGLLRPMKTKTYRIQDFTHITISREVRRSKDSSYTVYPVRIAGKGIDKFELSAERSEDKARNAAEKLAKFLELDIHDASEGEMRIRKPDTLDASLKEQFEKGSLQNEVPEPPRQLKSKIDYDGTSLSVDIPPAGFNPTLGIALFGFIAFELIILFVFILPLFRDIDFDEGFDFIFIVPFLLFALVPAAIIFSLLGKSLWQTQHLQVSSAGITLTNNWPLKRSLHQKADSIEEIYLSSSKRATRRSVGSGNPIVTRSDDKKLAFGSGLSREEAEYILALIKGILVS